MISLIPVERIEKLIYLIRGQKVMLDTDLADLYKVKTLQLNRQVKRNPIRFPEDFAFQLSKEEWEILRCQKGISSSVWGGRRYLPFAFTEQGVGMLASVLKSDRAAQVNVAIVRAFVRLRQLLSSHKDLAAKFDELEKKLGAHDAHIRTLFEAIRQLMNPAVPAPVPKPPIGYKLSQEKVAR